MTTRGIRRAPDTRDLPLCAGCAAAIGGACAGPDAEWRPALPGESCGAEDCGAECDVCEDDRAIYVARHGLNEDELGNLVPRSEKGG